MSARNRERHIIPSSGIGFTRTVSNSSHESAIPDSLESCGITTTIFPFSNQRPATSSARPPSRIKTRRTTDENNETVWLRFANAPATVSYDEKDYASEDYARCFVFSNYFLRVSFPTDSIVGPTKRLFVAVNRILILLKIYKIVSEEEKGNLSFKLLISWM